MLNSIEQNEANLQLPKLIMPRDQNLYKIY